MQQVFGIADQHLHDLDPWEGAEGVKKEIGQLQAPAAGSALPSQLCLLCNALTNALFGVPYLCV
jgi:hypothetical protein